MLLGRKIEMTCWMMEQKWNGHIEIFIPYLVILYYAALFDSLNPFSQETEVTCSRSLSRESPAKRVPLIWLRHPLSKPVREVTRSVASWGEVDTLKEN